MARIHTLRDRIKDIRRRYKRINRQKFLYNRKSDLSHRFQRITVWFLINSPSRGYSIMRMEFKRKLFMSVSQWHSLFKEGNSVGEKHYASLYSIFTQAVLPAINAKGGNDWRFVSVICWSASDFRQAKDSAAFRKRNKPTKKRNANARSRNRRR